MAHIIGADVGSQSVKALLMNPDGATVATATAPCSMSHPSAGWAEQEPDEWKRALIAAVRDLREQSGVARDEIEALSLACQVDGLVALDSELAPLRPAIIWLDRRATMQSEQLCSAAGEKELVARTGLNPDASHTAPKAMWLRDIEPEVYERTRWLAPVIGHLNGWLTGSVVQDHANASSTLLYDLAQRAWSSRLVDVAGLDAGRLPPICSATEVIGPLRAAAAEELGLSTTCRVVAGTGDDHGAALGAGALHPDVVVDITGTAEPVAVSSTVIVLDEQRLVETHAHAADGLLLVENPGFVSGGSTRWLAELLGIGQAELLSLAASAEPGAGGALFVPSLSGSTAPRWNDRMRGAFAGLAMGHGPAQLARAVLEGCAYALRDIVDRFASLGLGGDELRVVGGGARSQAWLQIKADVTGRPIRALEGDFATSAGAAMLGAVALGWFDDLDEAAGQCIRLAPEQILPRTELAGLYDESYAAYRRLFDGVEGALT
jgi:xylulokinase